MCWTEGTEDVIRRLKFLPGDYFAGDYERDFRPPHVLSILYSYFGEINRELVSIDNQNHTTALLSPNMDPKKINNIPETNKWKFDQDEWIKTWQEFGLLDYSQKFIL
jgi:hypothetical protein